MKLFLNGAFTILAILFIASCSQEEDLVGSAELKRMPYNETVFFLDKRDSYSHVYKVDYDFQGLTGDAVLEPFAKIEGGAHMTVSPVIEETGERYLTIVNNGGLGKIHLINVNDASDHRVLDLYKHTGAGSTADATSKNRVRITQVDFDKNNFLFIAGKDGFFRVSADYADMKPNVWTEGLENAGDVSESRVWAVKMANGGGIEMIEEDNEDYFDESDATSLKKPKFRGGDILFTQNADETAGFEKERLISVTQAHGNSALWVEMEFGDDNKAVKFSAKKLFNLKKVTSNSSTGEKGIGKVTGGALVGDNHLITSHHFNNHFEVRSLSGELIASPRLIPSPDVSFGGWTMVLDEEGFLKHNWGDMACVQTFDSDFSYTSRTIPTNTAEGYFPYVDGSIMAEVELYRPGSVVLNSYEVDDDNPEVSRAARRNSSNSDIVDLRQKPYKFASLGKNDGYMVLKFPNSISVSADSRLQVVETSWNKKPTYTDKDEAYRAYAEQASVYVSSYAGRYIGDWVDDVSNWIKVGDAFISSNEFTLDGISDYQWVKIVDDNSKTPDGFDVNFVAAYDLFIP